MNTPSEKPPPACRRTNGTVPKKLWLRDAARGEFSFEPTARGTRYRSASLEGAFGLFNTNNKCPFTAQGLSLTL